MTGLIRAKILSRPDRRQPDAVRCGRMVVRAKSGPCYALARRLLEIGVGPHTGLQVYATTGTPSVRGSVGDLARWSVGETDGRGLRRVRYAPRPALEGC